MAILLARGAKNIPAEVQRWQYFLLKHHVPQVGKIDADFGLATETATKIFQLQAGTKQTGKLDAKTHDAAVELGYRDLTPKYYEERKGVDWPPRPGFGSPGNASRNKALGCFRFVLQPEGVRPDHETIVIKGSCDGKVKDWVSENIVSFDVPQLQFASGFNHRFRCHKLIVPKVKALFENWEKEDLLHLFLAFDGAFVARYVRGTSLPAGGHGLKESVAIDSLSNHSFGSAFDVNAEKNPRGTTPPPEVHAKGSVRLLVPIANALGFFWGGHYRPPTKFDGMHFEYADFKKL